MSLCLNRKAVAVVNVKLVRLVLFVPYVMGVAILAALLFPFHGVKALEPFMLRLTAPFRKVSPFFFGNQQ